MVDCGIMSGRRYDMDRRILIVDDEEDILEILKVYLNRIGFTNVEVHTHWNACNPQGGDIVIHDGHGVGEKKLVQNVRYILFSGNSDLHPEIPKPFTADILRRVLVNE